MKNIKMIFWLLTLIISGGLVLSACQPVFLVSPWMLQLSPPAAGSIVTSDKDGMVSVYVPAGDFLMGSTQSESDSAYEECKNSFGDVCNRDQFISAQPQRTVYLDAYWMDKTEVTNEQYRKCVEDGVCTEPQNSGYYNDASYSNHPVTYVNWEQSRVYCTWVAGRLPTEAEWEKAARGNDGRRYPWGNEKPSKGLLNYNDNVGSTTPVGSYPQGGSPYGALDMSGNVWEWTSDWYSAEYYQNAPDRNPQGPVNGEYRVFRGGAWNMGTWIVRAAHRLGDIPESRNELLGFRCVR